ncbi:Uncharacterised protein [Campylobacter hyointestinalis]|uniref:hypothetical protein n=2 Tax=Campylobacter hyointestinalis TaxID=198 RepID=UPI00072986F3|nr:hypothetical protein [Campylobacter hyointestinalis]PPB51666.1 hypothetical protein CDQ67_10105 [Campylobacter hyointestinalis subsp. hyointestinalis]CUU67716.1 Uncharacterised protein [Campylobacter hyointestinalis]
MKKFALATIFLVSTLFSADNFTFEKVNNPKEVVSKAQKQSLKSKQNAQVRSYTPLPIDQFVFDENLDELTSVSSGGQHLFYLAYNKVQGDPTNFLIKNISQNYRCDYDGSHQANCDFDLYHTRVEYAFNSIGGWFYFTQYPTSNDNFVLISRMNSQRGSAEPLMLDTPSYRKPHFKVFVDTYGKLSVTFTLVTGGTQTVSTPQAIPLNTRVYLQANNSGIDYEVGWTTLDGTSSRASGSHQGFSIPADIDEHRVGRNTQKLCVSDGGGNATKETSGCITISSPFVEQEFNNSKNAYKTFSKYNRMTKFFWGYEVDMFSDMNTTNLSNKPIYQSNLSIDGNLINKILSDISGSTNNFAADELRLYVDGDYNVIVADIRAY